MKPWNKNTNAITEAQKLKERKKESHEDIGASGRDFFTHMGVVAVLVVVARGKQCGCEEEGQRQRQRARQTGIGRVASRQSTTTTERQEGSTASCSNKARESANRATVSELLRRRKAANCGAENETSGIYTGGATSLVR